MIHCLFPVASRIEDMALIAGGHSVMALYRINDVAERFGVSKSTLREWEQLGLVSPDRAPSGYRRYSDTDIARIADILRMRRIEGLNINAIAAVLRRSDTGGGRPGTARPPRPETRRSAGPPAATGPSLGQRLRTLRRRRGLSLSQAATKAGISRSALSLLERTSQGVGAATTRELAELYGLTMTELMAPLDGSDAPVVRSSEAQVLPTMGPGLMVAQLSSIPNAVMTCHLTVIQPGAGSQGSYCHQGEEFIYVLAGTFAITLDDGEAHKLGPGDSIYFESLRHHSWHNPGSEETRLLWINTPPTF